MTTPTTPPNAGFFFVQKLLFYGVVAGGFGAVILGIVVVIMARELPNIDNLSTYIPAETTKIYSKDGYSDDKLRSFFD